MDGDSASYDISTADWEWLRNEVHQAATAFGNQLRSIADGSTKVPNLEWSVADLGAHLVSLPGLYKSQNELTERFATPEDFGAFSLSVRSHITETDPALLADQLDAAIDDLFDDLGEDPNQQRTLYNQPTTSYMNAAGVLSELLMHGMDLAAITGAKVNMSKRQANAIVKQTMVLAPFFVDRERARKCPGTYHIRFRDGDDYTYVIADGQLTVKLGRPPRADAHIVADPAAFMLVSMGRMSQTRANLTGKIIGYGRKPWLLLPLGKIRADGV